MLNINSKDIEKRLKSIYGNYTDRDIPSYFKKEMIKEVDMFMEEQDGIDEAESWKEEDTKKRREDEMCDLGQRLGLE